MTRQLTRSTRDAGATEDIPKREELCCGLPGTGVVKVSSRCPSVSTDESRIVDATCRGPVSVTTRDAGSYGCSRNIKKRRARQKNTGQKRWYWARTHPLHVHTQHALIIDSHNDIARSGGEDVWLSGRCRHDVFGVDERAYRDSTR